MAAPVSMVDPKDGANVGDLGVGSNTVSGSLRGICFDVSGDGAHQTFFVVR
jgi:hypothetical protein